MQFIPTPAAYKLLHEGALALSEIEANGMRVDRDFLANSMREVEAEIQSLEQILRADPIYTKWVQLFGEKANLTSADQMAKLFFGPLGYKPRFVTGSGDRSSASEAAMAHIDLPFRKTYFEAAKLRKAHGTYLRGIWREMVQHDDGCWYVHPSFNLHTVETFRSSCSEPNVQNIPNRNPRIAEIVRRCYVARPGHQILELDYGQIEVRIPCAYHSDPTLMEYVFDPSKDMHRDTAAQIFLLTEKQAKQKNLRHYAKNQFVFPTFYGSIAQNIAPFIWELLERDKPTIDGAVGADGKPLLVMDHLASKGIKRLGACDLKQSAEPGTFEHHLIQIEKDFWDRRFKVYSQWKRDWYQAYLKNGGCRFLTGFVMKGVHAKNDVTNYPVQGCLPGTARIQTSMGWIPIRELVDTCSEVWTGFKWARATAMSRGLCRRAKVSLSSGLVIECDTRHKFKNEADEWVDFCDLKVGSFVALPKTPSPLSASTGVNWWFLYGFIIGDGHLSRNGVHLVGGDTKKEIIQALAEFLESEGYATSGYRSISRREIQPTENRTQVRHTLRLEDFRFAGRLRAAGFDFNWRAKTKRVPEAVWRASPQEQRDFLEGLWLSDGCRSPSRRLNMANITLLREVQVLAAGLGFDSDLRDRGDGGGYLSFSSRGFNKKASRKYPHSALKKKVSDVLWENYHNKHQAITDMRNWSSGEDVSQYVAERILENNSTADVYRYDSVDSIEVRDFEEETFTMSVEDQLHQFIADGVVCKNSAFHCTLWAMPRIQRRLKKYKFKTRMINEVHDSIQFDCWPPERDDVIDMSIHVMTEAIKKWATWLNVPLVVEPEACPIEGSWFDKHVLVRTGAGWVPADPAKWEKKHGAWE